jgi:hypothetical protein
MGFDPLRDIRTESQVVLSAVVTPGKMHQVHRADHATMPPMIEESH